MWSLPKPKLEDALADVDVFKSRGYISDSDAHKLKGLVMLYDEQSGRVSRMQHDEVPREAAVSMHSHYEDTSKKKTLNYIRQDLNKRVSRCPYCSVGEIGTLDHYMPKSVYKALSLCRLNLVPMCWKCNTSKSAKESLDNFVHPYYPPSIGHVVFLKAVAKLVDDYLTFSFYIDQQVLPSEYRNLFLRHWNFMDLEERLCRASIEFIHSELSAEYEDVISLRSSIGALIFQKEGVYGPNDWRTAILRALDDKLHGDQQEEYYEVISRLLQTAGEGRLY